MAVQLQNGSETSVTTLVAGILDDAQDLFKQQLALFKHEMRQDFARTMESMLSMVVGAGIGVIGVILLCVGVVHLLNWALPDWPLWTCYGVVGGALVLISGTLILLGWGRLKSFNPLPDESMQALKENVRWITNPK